MFLKKIYPPLQQSLEEAGLEKAWPFQKKMIGRIKSGGDMVAYADEGSGKTTALLIASIQILQQPKDDVPRCMILVQDNEKLNEVMEQFNQLNSHSRLRIKTADTRANILDQKDAIYFGSDIVVGIPSRIGDLMSIEGINISEIRHIFIDDATTLMRHEVLSQIHRILESFPKAQLVFTGREQTDSIERYAQNFMKIPELLQKEAE